MNLSIIAASSCTIYLRKVTSNSNGTRGSSKYRSRCILLRLPELQSLKALI